MNLFENTLGSFGPDNKCFILVSYRLKTNDTSYVNYNTIIETFFLLNFELSTFSFEIIIFTKP